MSRLVRHRLRVTLMSTLALTLAMVSVPGAGLVATAAAPRCKVTNATRPAHPSFGTLQEAVDAALAHDVLQVRGVCLGATIIAKDLTVQGITTAATGTPALDGAKLVRPLETAAGTTVAISGLIIRKGVALGLSYPDGAGGAILVGGSLTLTNVEIVNSHAQTNGGSGAIELLPTGVLVMAGTTRLHDSHGAYGAIEVYGTLIVRDHARIDHNEGLLYGGAIYADGVVTLRDHARIDHNVAPVGGGVYLGGGSLTLKGAALIDRNTATDLGGGSGGGIYDERGTLIGAACGVNVKANTPDQITPACPL